VEGNSPVNNGAYPPDVPEHLAIAEAKIEELRLRAHHTPRPFWTLTGMVRAWRDVSEVIDRGYQLTIDDYTNELSVRGLLDEVLAVIPTGSVRDWVERDVQVGDERYRKVTHDVALPIFGGPDAPWWYRRVPNRITGELAEDLNPDGTARRRT
jgi:hypothetical protein